MINKHELKNGIRVVCERMESIRSVSAGVWVGAGSRYESAERLGISHFIEHMLFKGTRRRTARQIAEEIDFTGGQINAFTSKDCTCFYTKTLDNHLGLAIDVLSDILLHSKLKKSDINLERNVILEEINMTEDSPDELVHDLLTESVWGGCALGNPILGKRETLTRTEKADMREYMAHRYAAPNIVVSVAGSFDETALLANLEKAFGKVGATAPDGGFFQPTDSVDYSPCVNLRSKDTEQIHLCLGFNGIELGCDDLYALQLVNSALGGGMSSVLFQKIREELGLVYSIYSYAAAYRGAGLFAIYAGMQPENAEIVYELIVGELKSFIQSGMDETLLARTKEQFKGGFLMGLENPGARMSSMGKSELLQGYVKTPDEIVDKIDKVTLDEAYRIMRNVIDFNGLAVSAAGRVSDGFEAVLRRQA